MRGAKFFICALGARNVITPGTSEIELSACSFMDFETPLYSQRKPRFSVSRRVAFQLSFA